MGFAIKLSNDYTGGDRKQIGKFVVTRQWKDCTGKEVRCAAPFEGTVYAISRATIKGKTPKPDKVIEAPAVQAPELPEAALAEPEEIPEAEVRTPENPDVDLNAMDIPGVEIKEVEAEVEPEAEVEAAPAAEVEPEPLTPQQKAARTRARKKAEKEAAEKAEKG